MRESSYWLAAISAVAVALGHEWLHRSDITQDLPELGVIGGVSAEIGSVSVGLVALTFASMLINSHVSMEEK